MFRGSGDWSVPFINRYRIVLHQKRNSRVKIDVGAVRLNLEPESALSEAKPRLFGRQDICRKQLLERLRQKVSLYRTRPRPGRRREQTALVEIVETPLTKKPPNAVFAQAILVLIRLQNRACTSKPFPSRV
jgi:hypothetical protein